MTAYTDAVREQLALLDAAMADHANYRRNHWAPRDPETVERLEARAERRAAHERGDDWSEAHLDYYARKAAG